VSYTLPLGPFHPGLLAPQAFVFRVTDEHIVDVEYQNAVNERNCAARMVRLDPASAFFLASRVCGECSFAHAAAFSTAVEQLCGLTLSRRAQQLRVVAAELERSIAHLRGSAGILEAAGMTARARPLLAARSELIGLFERLTGARIAADYCVPGGLSRDLGQLQRKEILTGLAGLERTLYTEVDLLIDHQLLLLRTIDVGTILRAAAEQLGVRGPLARSAGVARDTRSDMPYWIYGEYGFSPVVQEGGDVYARLVVLLLEAYESIKLAERCVRELDDAPSRGTFPAEVPSGSASATIEGPRGRIRYAIESDGTRLTTVRIDTPRQFDRLLVRTFFSGAAIDNAALIAASAYPCIACAEC
jgi:Ni,Fe-hydrogenase III large subunit